MTVQNDHDLLHTLATELETLSGDGAERLCNILRGMFTCMQDLNERLSALERDATRSDLAESRSSKEADSWSHGEDGTNH